MKKKIVIGAFAVTGLFSFDRRTDVSFTVPEGWPEPEYDFQAHHISTQKVELGRKLFYETLLSRDNTISCSSCHIQYTGFTHSDHSLSHGIMGRIGRRNSPALMNLAWSKSFMWDGAIENLDVQAQKPITNPLEMDETITNVVGKLQASIDYPQAFYKAFGDSMITSDAVMQSLSQFMLTMVSANAKYDKVMRHADSFTTREANGYKLFRAHCSSCHPEPLFTNGKFENNGLPPDDSLRDKGRSNITGLDRDDLKFKVPTLRNIEVTYPYMHDGRFKNLQMVLFHYTENIYQSSTLSNKLKRKLNLSEQEKGDIIMFLKTLTDEDFLKDKKFGFTKN